MPKEVEDDGLWSDVDREWSVGGGEEREEPEGP